MAAIRTWDDFWIADRRKRRGEAAPVKAQSGAGVLPMEWDPSISSHLSGEPHRLMAEAQTLFHRNAWVAAAERTIVGRYLRLPWHLEESDGDSVDEGAPDAEKAVLRLIEQPNKRQRRRDLWSLTLRHLGLCGNAFWFYDQVDRQFGIPLQILYINPARMDPVLNGGELLGWVLDAPTNPLRAFNSNPTPLDVEQVEHFTLDPPDVGVWGIGVAESVAAKIELNRLATTQASKVMASGGRIPGLLMPKDNGQSISPEQYAQIVRDWRNITADPDSARRLQIVRAPMDFQQIAANPRDLELQALMTESRDEILSAWGVPPTQIGVPEPRGLNSGQSESYHEAALWQGAIAHRAQTFEETVQHGLLARFSMAGVALRLVVEYPTFDDKTPMFDLAMKAASIPMRNDERRAIIGLDPFGDDVLDAQVLVEQTMTPLGEVAAGPSGGGIEQAPAPAKASGFAGIRQQVLSDFTPRLRSRVAAVLSAMGEEISRRAAKHADALRANPRDTTVWWDPVKWQGRLREALTPEYTALATEVGNRISVQLRDGPAHKADNWMDRVHEYITGRAGSRIVGIADTTRDDILGVILRTIQSGDITRLATEIRDATAFDELRAETIARTELAYAYNDAAIGSYQQSGVQMVDVTDGDGDAICASVDGARWTLDEAAMDPLGHPNCTRDFIPVV